jgi:BirA family transcriptional regulator, biotin operon repressor / biotin---[acetyl-CoA-carboxylase] ligase
MEHFNIIRLEETASTNEYLKNLAEKDGLPEGFAVFAKSQTGGRGQQGNIWESEPGKNINLSFLLRPEFLSSDKVFMISKVVSLAIVDYLNNLGKTFTIKWPNDIYYQDKKVAGILIENQFIGNSLEYCIIGIGLNVNQEVFNSGAPNPIALIKVFKKCFDVEEVLHGLLNQIMVWYEMLIDGWEDKINEAYFTHLYRTEGYHDFLTPGGQIHGHIIGVEPNGELKIKDPHGNVSGFYFKEIEFVYQ